MKSISIGFIYCLSIPVLDTFRHQILTHSSAFFLHSVVFNTSRIIFVSENLWPRLSQRLENFLLLSLPTFFPFAILNNFLFILSPLPLSVATSQLSYVVCFCLISIFRLILHFLLVRDGIPGQHLVVLRGNSVKYWSLWKFREFNIFLHKKTNNNELYNSHDGIIC